MKINRILSSALVVVLLFGAVIGVVPMKASAAYTNSNSSVEQSLGANEILELVTDMYVYDFDSAVEMLAYEQEQGYIVSVGSDNSNYPRYTLHVNRYTGFVYYQDNLTGQILTSNPYTYPEMLGTLVSDVTKDMSSQLVIYYSSTTSSTTSQLYSSTDAASEAQISVDYIAGGIRVNYTLGDTVARYLLPGYITAEKLESELLVPMLNEIRDVMIKYCAKETDDLEKYDIFKAKKYNPKTESRINSVYYRGAMNHFGVQAYIKDMEAEITKTFTKANGNENSAPHKELQKLINDLRTIYASTTNCYTIMNLEREPKYADFYKDKYYSQKGSEISKTYEPIYIFTGTTNPMKSVASEIFETYVNKYREEKAVATGEDYSKYSFAEMYEDEDYCGYVDETDPKPVFRCALEYSFNSDGSLSVRLPANSISFDKTLYNLESIAVLKYFGAADATKDGHIFFPDGSGMILEYRDFYNAYSGFVEYTAVGADIYGTDNSYYPEVDPAKIEGAYREQVTMPIFGVVGTENASQVSSLYSVSEVTNGYFAIVEKGASLARIEFQTGKNNTASAYCTYSPYPSDRYDLSNTLSVGGADYYTIVSDAKFNGSYVTRYAMLTDPIIGETIKNDYRTDYYTASYSGMATYYRDYLYDNGTLTALTDINDNMPLYIEALGSMDIMDKFLTFPVEKSIALTTFEDVATIYNELRNSSAVLSDEAAKYQALADAEPEGSVKKAEYQAMADKCTNFIINNINFRLTGFGSGGLNSNYPTKLRWEKACGGKKGFKELLETAKEATKNGDVFGIYPEYDFLYLSNQTSFDGVSKKKDASLMIDNRYASKQVYDSISRQYVSYFSLVVNPDSLDKLYSKFVNKYDKYAVAGISVSTMGSDLNSNFDSDNPINRDDAQTYVENVLTRMVKQNEYSVMLDKGNIYSVRYASHLLNVATDSSRLRFSSYSVPFIGMILHGALNYAGKPLNYSGMPEYDLLRSIESGASLYFILCYQNESYMKNDAILNDYFGVSYDSWYKDIVLNYYKLSNAIGDLQDYIITDHKTVIGERVIDSEELLANYKILMDEIIEMMDGQLDIQIERGYEYLQDTGKEGILLTVDIDEAALLRQFEEDILRFKFDEVEAGSDLEALVNSFKSDVAALVDRYEAEYPGPAVATDAPYSDTNPDGNYYVVSYSELIYGVSDTLISDMLKVLEDEIKSFVEETEEYVKAYNKAIEDEEAAGTATEKKHPLQFVLEIQRDALLQAMADVCKIDFSVLEEYTIAGDDKTFGEHVDEIIAVYKAEHPDFEEEKDSITQELIGNKKYKVTMDSMNTESLYLYASKYSFITDSFAFDETYIYTDYTSDRGNIVLVTYTKGDKQVKFLLNYNIYAVEVNISETESYTLGKYEYIRIEG